MLEKPTISVYRDKSGRFNISDLLEGKKEGLALQIKGIRIKKGRVRFNDLAASEKVDLSLEETDLSLDHLMRGKTCHFKFSTYVAEQGNRGAVTLAGSARLPETGKSLSDTRLNGTVRREKP